MDEEKDRILIKGYLAREKYMNQQNKNYKITKHENTGVQYDPASTPGTQDELPGKPWTQERVNHHVRFWGNN